MTLPARQYSVDGERRSFTLLRPISDTAARERIRDPVKKAGDRWTDEGIRVRTQGLAVFIIQIWPVPPGHRSGFSPDRRPRPRKKAQLSDLIGRWSAARDDAAPSSQEAPQSRRHLPDGQVEVDGVAYSSPTGAATAIDGKRTKGWAFFLTDQAPHAAHFGTSDVCDEGGGFRARL